MDRREQLQNLISHYRRRLAEGVDAMLVRVYVQEIIRAEAELALLDEVPDKRK